MKSIPLPTILFLDIETVPEVYRYNELSPLKQELFSGKTRWIQPENSSAEELYSRAGVYAEFGKIICISMAWVGEDGWKTKSIFGHDERMILLEFNSLLSSLPRITRFCAHNGKEFDFPWLCRRMIINSIQLPAHLNIQGKKPWEIPHLDTMELWKFGDHKHFTSLELLAEILGIPSPKDQLRGSDVARVYWEENDLEKIKDYCVKDVQALVKVFLRLRGEIIPVTISNEVLQE